MLSESVANKIDEAARPDDGPRDPEENIVVTLDTLPKELYHEKWTHRRAAFTLLRDTFGDSSAPQQAIDLFTARVLELLTEKNVVAMEELLAALRNFLQLYSVPKSFIQNIVNFFCQNIPAKKLEKGVLEIVQTAAELAPEIAFGSVLRRLEVESQALQQTHILGFLQALVPRMSSPHPATLRALMSKLKGLLANPNQRVRKMALEIICETVRFVQEDIGAIQKHFFEGLKEAQLKEILAASQSEKQQGAVPVLEERGGNPSTNLGNHSHLPHSESEFLGGKGRFQTEQDHSHRNPEGREFETQAHGGRQNPPSNRPLSPTAADDLPPKRQKLFRVEPPKEPALPDKLLEIINLKTIDERVDVLQAFRNQLADSHKFNTVFPSQIFPLLVNELKESNLLLYSIVLEVFALLLRKAKSKQGLHQGLAKQLAQVAAYKYNVKATLNPLIIETIDCLAKREYIPGEALVKFMLEEVSLSKTRNLKQCFLDWLAGRLPRVAGRPIFREFGKRIRAGKEAKQVLQKFSDETKNGGTEFPNPEVAGYLFVRLAKMLDEEKLGANKQLIREAVGRLRESVCEVSAGKGEDLGASDEAEMSETEVEKNKLLKKLTAICSQVGAARESDLAVARELHIASIYDIVDQFEKLESPTAVKVAKALDRLFENAPATSPRCVVQSLAILGLLYEEEAVKTSRNVFVAAAGTWSLADLMAALLKLYNRSTFKRNYLRINQGFVDVLPDFVARSSAEEVQRALAFLAETRSPNRRYLNTLATVMGQRDAPPESLAGGRRGVSARPDKFGAQRQSVGSVRGESVALPKIKGTKANEEPTAGGASLETERRPVDNHQLPKIALPKPEASQSAPEVRSQQMLPTSATFESVRESFLGQLSAVSSLGQITDFVSRISNDYRTLQKLLNAVTFKELSGSLERCLELIGEASGDPRGAFQDLIVLVLSLIAEGDKEKFLVLTLTYFARFRTKLADCLNPFFGHCKNPFLCYKFAFGLVGKQYDETGKGLFLVQTLDYMLGRLGRVKQSLDDPHYGYLLEMLVAAASWEGNGNELEEDLERRIGRLRQEARRILGQIFRQNPPEKVQKKFEKELGNSAKAFRAFSRLYEELTEESRSPPKRGMPYNVVSAESFYERGEPAEARGGYGPGPIDQRPPVATESNEQSVAGTEQEGLFYDGQTIPNESHLQQGPQGNEDEGQGEDMELRNSTSLHSMNQDYGADRPQTEDEDLPDHSSLHRKSFGGSRASDLSQTRQEREEEVRQPPAVTRQPQSWQQEPVQKAAAIEIRDYRNQPPAEQGLSRHASPDPRMDGYPSYKNIRALRKQINSVEHKSPPQAPQDLDKMTSEEPKKKSFVVRNIFGQKDGGFGVEAPLNGRSPVGQAAVGPSIPGSQKFEAWARSRSPQAGRVAEAKSERKEAPRMESTSRSASRVSDRSNPQRKELFSSTKPTEVRRQPLQKAVPTDTDKDAVAVLTQTGPQRPKGYAADLFRFPADPNMVAKPSQPAPQETKPVPPPPSAAKFLSSISTQTDLTDDLEEQQRRLASRVTELTDKNAQITSQLYALSQINDELNEENRVLKTRLAASAVSSQTNIGATAPVATDKITPEFADLLMECGAVNPAFFEEILTTYGEKSDDEKEKMLFDLKFYVLDSGLAQFVEPENYRRLLDFMFKVTLAQTLADSSANQNIHRLSSSILDVLLQAPPKPTLVWILVRMIREALPSFTSPFDNQAVLYIKLVSKIAFKLAGLLKKDLTKAADGQGSGQTSVSQATAHRVVFFRALVEVFLIFRKAPPEQLTETTPRLDVYDELFRDIKAIADEVWTFDPAAGEQFVRLYKAKHGDSMFVQYIQNAVAKH